MAVQLRRRLFTVDEYYRMGQAAILVEDDRVELLEGQIVKMGPLRSWRQATVDRLILVIFQPCDGPGNDLHPWSSPS